VIYGFVSVILLVPLGRSGSGKTTFLRAFNRLNLLDEPTASLDFQASVKVEGLLLSLKERYTIIAVSHSLTQARRLADEALIFRDSSVVKQLSPEDLQASDTLQTLLEEIF
jgi:phosphate transport system ATP-binding protein